MKLAARLKQYVLPEWTRDCCPDRRHPHRRRFTASYRRKRSIVKNVWIASGLLMLAHGSVAMIFALGLGTTFLSFMILDETP